MDNKFKRVNEEVIPESIKPLLQEIKSKRDNIDVIQQKKYVKSNNDDHVKNLKLLAIFLFILLGITSSVIWIFLVPKNISFEFYKFLPIAFSLMISLSIGVSLFKQRKPLDKDRTK
jgi:hypothetical protein